MPKTWYNSDRSHSIVKRIAVFFGFLLVYWALSFIPAAATVIHAIEGNAYQVGSLIGRASSRLFANENSLSAQLNTCLNRLNSTTVIAASSETNAREIEELRALLRYTMRINITGISARIIARNAPEESVVIVDKGANEGIQIGSAVIVGDGVLFGTIEDVNATTATVRLTEDPKSIIPGAILGTQKTIGLVSGREGALLSMDYIPQDTQISENDIVITSGLGGRLSAGIVIGTIIAVTPSLSAPFVSASISPVHDPREWTAVLILPYQEIAL